MRPTIVLVHGAFAESASWDRVIDPLLSAGHPVIAAANPLRGLAADAAAVSDLVRTVDGPVRARRALLRRRRDLERRRRAGAIAGLVSSPASHRTRRERHQLSGLFPGSTLGDALQPVSRSDGTTDLFISQSASTLSSPRTCRRRRRRGWRPPSGRSRRRRSSSRRASVRCGRSCRHGSCSARKIATSGRRSSTSWPSAPRAAHDRDPGRVACDRRLAPRRDGSRDPRGRAATLARCGAGHGRLAPTTITHAESM